MPSKLLASTTVDSEVVMGKQGRVSDLIAKPESLLLGFSLGLVLVMTGSNNLLDFPQVHQVLSAIINTGRSFPFKVSVTEIISEDILKFVNTKLARQARLEIKVVTFNDWIQPNTALRDQVIDANFFQYRPLMNNGVNKIKISLVSFNTVTFTTVGLFFHKFKSVNEVLQNTTVTIANDLINNDRGLRLLAANNLLQLKHDGKTKELVTQRDIFDNPKNFRINQLKKYK